MFHCQYLLFRQIAELEVKWPLVGKSSTHSLQNHFLRRLVLSTSTLYRIDQIGQFLKVFGNKFFYKSSPNICFLVLTVWPFRKLLATHFLTIVAQIFPEFMGQCKSSTFLVKRNVTDLVVTFGKTAKFLFHHLVSLLIHNIFANICRTYWQ